MLVAFEIPESYSHQLHYARARDAVGEICARLPEAGLEFFYYLRPSATERFFVIRAKIDRRREPLFRRAAQDFALQLNFTIVPDGDGYRLARKLDINSFC